MKQNKIPRNEYIVKPKGKTDPYKDDVQYTNLGQWKYPGQVTKIPSNDITMQGVNYPVYGEDDLGYGQMMYPGMDYQFPGQYVTEYPMARYGGGLPKAQKGKQKGNAISNWWNNVDDVQSTYKMAPDVDPFLVNWLQHPETQKRLSKNLKSNILTNNINPKTLTKEAINKLNALPMFSRELVKKADVSQNDIEYNNSLQGWKTPSNIFSSNPYFSSDPGELGVYLPNYHVSMVNTFNNPGVITHEQTHGAGPLQKTMEDVILSNYLDKKQNSDKKFVEMYGDYNFDDNYNKVYDSFDKAKQKYPGIYSEFEKQKKYLDKDGMYPRIMDIRRTLNLKPGQKVNKFILDNESIKLPISDLRFYYDDDTIIDMLNTLAKNNQTKDLNTVAYGGDPSLPNIEDSGWLDEYQVGGSKYGDLRPTSDATRVVIPNLPKKALTKKEKQEVKQYEIKQAARDLEKAQKIVDKFNRIKAANKAQAEQGFPTTRQEWADQTQAIGDKLSLQNLPVVGKYIPDMLDVTGGIGNMGSALASAPLRSQQENSYMPYFTGIGSPLLAGALGSIGAKNTRQFVNNVVNPFAGLEIPGSSKVIKYAGNKLDKASRKVLGDQATDQLKHNINTVIKNYKNEKNFIKENKNELEKLPGLYKQNIKEMTSPEGLARLKNLGVNDPSDFIKFANNVKKTGTSLPSQYLPINQGVVNINPNQLNKYKKTLMPLATPQNAIDHEYGHLIQHYLENKGKTFKGLTDLDIEAVDELFPHINKETSDYFKTINGIDLKSAKETAKLNNTELPLYFFKGSNGAEPIAHLRETKRAMKESGVINNIHENITPQHIEDFVKKTGNKDRITSFLQKTPEAYTTLSKLLNKTPAVIPAIGAGILGTKGLQEEKDGGWLDNYEDEFKKGGQKGLKRFTSKNIQTSINDIMLRNETIYGPSGKRRYKPNLKYQDGGESTNWLDDI